MGSLIGKQIEESTKKNQEFMMEMQRIQLERQIQMQNQMRERMMAMQVARARELLYWFGSFYVIAALGMIAGFKNKKKPVTLVPLLPLTFILGYQADLAYGRKLERIKAESENILLFEHEKLDLPWGLPTPSSIDQARMKQRDSSKFHKSPNMY